jgi:hypothetical protein
MATVTIKLHHNPHPIDNTQASYAAANDQNVVEESKSHLKVTHLAKYIVIHIG